MFVRKLILWLRGPGASLRPSRSRALLEGSASRYGDDPATCVILPKGIFGVLVAPRDPR